MYDNDHRPGVLRRRFRVEKPEKRNSQRFRPSGQNRSQIWWQENEFAAENRQKSQIYARFRADMAYWIS